MTYHRRFLLRLVTPQAKINFIWSLLPFKKIALNIQNDDRFETKIEISVEAYTNKMNSTNTFRHSTIKCVLSVYSKRCCKWHFTHTKYYKKFDFLVPLNYSITINFAYQFLLIFFCYAPSHNPPYSI